MLKMSFMKWTIKDKSLALETKRWFDNKSQNQIDTEM